MKTNNALILALVISAFSTSVFAKIEYTLKNQEAFYQSDSGSKKILINTKKFLMPTDSWASVTETALGKKTFIEFKAWSEPAGTSSLNSTLWWLVLERQGDSFRQVLKEEIANRRYEGDKIKAESKPAKTEIKLEKGQPVFLIDNSPAKNLSGNK